MQMIKNYPPPKETRLVMRIGVIGHNSKDLGPNAENSVLVSKIQEVIKHLQTASQLLAHCKDLYADKLPILRIISPLGSGAELLVTREAVNKNFELQCILPSESEKYKEEWLDLDLYVSFDTLFKAAQVKIELDSSREVARKATGQAMLRQCDLLLAVWNSEAGVKGDPGAIVAEALSRGIPIIWIDARQDHNVCLLERREKSGASEIELDLKNLFDRLTSTFHMRHQTRAEKVDPAAALKRFLAKKQPRPFPLYRSFRNLIGRGWRKRLESLGWSLPEKKDKPAEDRWNKLAEPNNLIGEALAQGCQLHLKRADDLADAYGDIYRSFFIVTYCLGAAAVVAAFFGIYVNNLHEAFQAELFLITLILIV